jgi:hypothetical protein
MASGDISYYSGTSDSALASLVDPLTTGTAPTHALATGVVAELDKLRGQLFNQALTEL